MLHNERGREGRNHDTNCDQNIYKLECAGHPQCKRHGTHLNHRRKGRLYKDLHVALKQTHIAVQQAEGSKRNTKSQNHQLKPAPYQAYPQNEDGDSEYQQKENSV